MAFLIFSTGHIQKRSLAFGLFSLVQITLEVTDVFLSKHLVSDVLLFCVVLECKEDQVWDLEAKAYQYVGRAFFSLAAPT